MEEDGFEVSMEKEMIAYLPTVLRGVRDFQCLSQVYQGEFGALWERERAQAEELFMEGAVDRGLAHWERIFGILPSSMEREMRRQVIAAHMRGRTPYHLWVLQDMLAVLIGDARAVSLWVRDLVLGVELKRVAWGHEAVVWEIVRNIVPANVQIVVTRMKTTHRGLGQMRHAEMQVYTHQTLREGVER